MSKRKPKPSKHDGTAKNEEGLTAQQQLFVKHLLADPSLNATKAATDAGYSEKTAGQLAYQLLQKPSIKKAIDDALAERFERLDIRADRVLLELRRIAYGTLRDVAKWGSGSPELKDSGELTEDAAALMKSITFSESESSNDKGSSSSRTMSFAMHDKVKALELLGKKFKLFTDVIEHDVSDGLAARLDRARKKKEGKK